ncbi:MAG: 3-keto-disaccharide hydrolase [Verrucomicrobiaceae bacterium]
MIKTLALSLLLPFSFLHADHHGEKKETPAAQEEKWIPLFNGKDLTGWTPKFSGSDLGVNYKDTFLVKDGLLTIDYSNWEKFAGEFGHLFYKTPYSHYNIRATYRFIGDQVKAGPGWANRNNGFMLHCQDPKTIKKDQDFPNSIEVQFLGGLGKGDRGTLNICTPGTQLHWDGKLSKAHVINTGGPTIHGDDWVTVEVQVRGDKFKHIANGQVVCEYDNTQLDDGSPLTSGYISIQAETAPIQFKSIEIQPLKE